MIERRSFLTGLATTLLAGAQQVVTRTAVSSAILQIGNTSTRIALHPGWLREMLKAGAVE